MKLKKSVFDCGTARPAAARAVAGLRSAMLGGVRWRPWSFCVLLVGLALHAAAADDSASLDAEVLGVAGSAYVQRAEQRLLLVPGSALLARDVLHTDAGSVLRWRVEAPSVDSPAEGGAGGEAAAAAMTAGSTPSSPAALMQAALALTDIAELQLGPDSAIAIETLARGGARVLDGKTILSFAQGNLRINWRAPTQPLYVFFSGQRARFSSGEYLLDGDAAGQRLCVLNGAVKIIPSRPVPVLVLRNGQCAVLDLQQAPRVQAVPAAVVARQHELAALYERQAQTLARLAATAAAAADSSDTVPAGAQSSAQSSSQALLQSSAGVAPNVPDAAATARADAPIADQPPPTLGASGAADTASDAATVTGPGDNAATPSWTLNLGSFTDPTVADGERQRLRAAGYAAIVQTIQINGRDWYRVQLPGQPDADTARARAEELKARFGYKSVWVMPVVE